MAYPVKGIDMPKTTAALQSQVRKAAHTLDRFKVERGCSDCGYRTSPMALHFDHVDPMTKRADLGWFGDRSKLTTPARLERFLAHVERYCVLRCANCHAERTASERHWLVRRGVVAAAPVATLF